MTYNHIFVIIISRIEVEKMKKKIKKNTKTYRIINLISRMIAVLLTIAVIALVGFVIYLNVIPTKYIVGVGILLLVIMVCTLFVLISNRIKAKWKIIISLMSLLIIGGISFGMIFGFNIMSFLDDLASKDYMTENYYVIVLKDGIYSNLDDLSNTDMLMYNNDSDGVKKALKELNKEINVNVTNSPDLSIMVNSLLNQEVEAIIMESSYKNILDEQNEQFKNSTKIVYTISVKVATKTILKEVGITQEPFVLYICGVDTYGPITSVSRSDVNIVATINPKTKQVLLTSIPRDYYVQLHNTTGYKDKLTHAGIYGVNMSISTIEDLLDIDINYYAKVNFDSLIKIVDVLGGIDVYVDKGFSSADYYFKAGYNHMNGKKALSFSRERHAFVDGDRSRGKNQEAVIRAIVEKVSSPSVLTKYSTILNSLDGSFETNINSQNIKKLVKMQLNDMASWNIVSSNLNGTDSSNFTHSFSQQMLYVMEPTQSTMDDAKAMMKQVRDGKTLVAKVEAQ